MKHVARLSISRAWDEAKAVLAQDRGPIATVALALLVLPGVVSEFIIPPAPAGETPGLGWSLVSLAVLIVAIIGQLTLSRIASGHRQSVGEAMSHGVRRAPAFLLAIMIWLLPFGLVLAPFALQIQANPTQPSPAAAFAVLLVAIAFIIIGVRLVFSTPVAANEAVGPLAILKRSWRLTAGHWWRLFGFLALFMIAAVITLGAVTAMIGVVVALLTGEPERLSVGALVVAVVTQLVAAGITVLLTVLLTRIYLQLAEPSGEPASVPHAP